MFTLANGALACFADGFGVRQIRRNRVGLSSGGRSTLPELYD